jgi:hypothetical protein
MRNNSTVALAAFAISVKYVTRNSANNNPLVVYVDPLVDALPMIGFPRTPPATGPLLPNQEFTCLPEQMVPNTPNAGKPLFEQPVTAGIFVDGATTGDPALLTRLMLRRGNMLLAVETTLETLFDAGRRNVPRDQLIGQFRAMADSVRRWYLPYEQQVGLGLYRSIIGKLTNLPAGQAGSPFPPSDFVEQEVALLRPHRVALLESQPSLADMARIGR